MFDESCENQFGVRLKAFFAFDTWFLGGYTVSFNDIGFYGLNRYTYTVVNIVHSPYKNTPETTSLAHIW